MRKEEARGGRTDLLGQGDEGEPADGGACPEAGRDVPRVRPAMTLCHEGDDPAADCHLEADVQEQEEGQKVDCRQVEDPLVLSDSIRGVLAVLHSGLADLFHTICASKHDAIGVRSRVMGE